MTGIEDITWEMGPPMPYPTKGQAQGVIGDSIVAAAGVGHVGWDLVNRHGRANGTRLLNTRTLRWESLPDAPVGARWPEGVGVGDAFFMVTGWITSKPPDTTTRRMFRLSRHGGAWRWDEMPPMRVGRFIPGVAASGTLIVVVGGQASFDGDPRPPRPAGAVRQRRRGLRHRRPRARLVRPAAHPGAAAGRRRHRRDRRPRVRLRRQLRQVRADGRRQLPRRAPRLRRRLCARPRRSPVERSCPTCPSRPRDGRPSPTATATLSSPAVSATIRSSTSTSTHTACPTSWSLTSTSSYSTPLEETYTTSANPDSTVRHAGAGAAGPAEKHSEEGFDFSKGVYRVGPEMDIVGDTIYICAAEVISNNNVTDEVVVGTIVPATLRGRGID